MTTATDFGIRTVGRLTRDVFRRERVPVPLLWVMAADGLATWYLWLARELTDVCGGRDAAKAAIARAAAPAFERRGVEMCKNWSHLPDPAVDSRVVPLVIASLYRSPVQRAATWMLDGLGGGPRGPVEWARAWRLVAPMSFRDRWLEVATHLGEVLISLTQNLPAEGVPRSNAVLGRLCLDAGALYGRMTKVAFDLPDTPESVIEVLRITEYIFRVNADHWTTTDTERRAGTLEGSACPWYQRPGWAGMHCGIFGQFQSGVASVFGLRYHLTKTIPRHGGTTCCIEVRPPASTPVRPRPTQPCP